MSKKKRDKREMVRAAQEARKLTPGKLFRLFLKSIVFAVVVGILFTVLSLLGVPGLDNWWMQFALIFVVYLLAYPFIMSEFRAKTYLKKRS
jgi:uncharacterized membrane protein